MLALAALHAISQSLLPLPESLSPDGAPVRKARILDRNGVPLSITYSNEWNVHDCIPLHEVPPLLRDAFIQSEDRRFFQHKGVDWTSRFHAAIQNAMALRIVRGASTITEQVVRILHPRPRTFRSRFIEGIEAGRLEERFSKEDILEFYLNQVPYARQRRGVVQAARMYFDRDIETLSIREMLALAVLVRAPSRQDLRLPARRSMDTAVARLAKRMLDYGLIPQDRYAGALSGPWSLHESKLPTDAGHFIRFMGGKGLLQPSHAGKDRNSASIITTLDTALQDRVQRILDSRVQDLHDSRVHNAAVLVVDHQTDEVLAWVNGRSSPGSDSYSWIDAVTALRQPGSTLKPFVYALALDTGWTPATIIDDSPLAEAIGSGLHSFHNYSRTHYGPLRLRDALGNSLNIPAIRTIQFTGTDNFLNRLHQLGFHSLVRPADYYGAGLVLGDGEVSLLELVQAYAVLARHGIYRPLRIIVGDSAQEEPRRIFSDEAASMIADILSDPQARRLEFGDGHLLRLPVQTAVKTGTSNDYKDAWVVGFSHRFTIGVWMGNFDRLPTHGVTGTVGPGMVLRAVFAELNRYEEGRPLYHSPRLVPLDICRISGLRAEPDCPVMREWFMPSRIPDDVCSLHTAMTRAGARTGAPLQAQAQPDEADSIRLLQPTPGLQLAMDPHIPDELEAFALVISGQVQTRRTEWVVDAHVEGTTGPNEHRFLWHLSRGTHTARARIWPIRPTGGADTGEAERPIETPLVRFTVN